MKQLIPMTAPQYERMLDRLRKTPRREKIAAAGVKLLPPVFFAVYAVELLLLFLQAVQSGLAADPLRRLIGAVLFPALCLLTSSLLRKKLNRPRPYEALPIRPLIQKDTCGRSFPSNHTASAFVLAWTAFRLSFPLGCLLLVLAAVTGLSRVAAGLHWPEDVLAGCLLGTALGVIGLAIF